MIITAAIPCRDRLSSLLRCLRSIEAARLHALNRQGGHIDRIRALVVDDRSEKGFAPAITRQFGWVEVQKAKGIGPGAARNSALTDAQTDLFLFTDSDCIVSVDWFVRAERWYRESRMPIGQGVPWLHQKKGNARLGDLEERLYALMFSSYIDGNSTTMVDPRCLAIRQSFVESFGPGMFADWMTDASAEDRAMVGSWLEHGAEIAWLPDLKVFHEDPESLTGKWDQNYRYGFGRADVWASVPSVDSMIQRYFLDPVANGIDPHYVVPCHIAFLLGYRDSLEEKGHVEWWNDLVSRLTGHFTDTASWQEKVETALAARRDSISPLTIRNSAESRDPANRPCDGNAKG